MLDTQAKALLQLMVERQVPPVNTLPPEQAREFYLVRKSLTQPDPPSVASPATMGPAWVASACRCANTGPLAFSLPTPCRPWCIFMAAVG